MGLILSTLSAVGSEMRDQWKELFYADALPSNVIAIKASKKTHGASSNHGNDNVITSGSTVIVADGQLRTLDLPTHIEKHQAASRRIIQG